ncbi:MAG: MFS transporter [Blastocatellia bacterium]
MNDRIPVVFRAFRHRNFRLFMGGQLLSMAGTWVQRVAQGWLAYRLSGSPLLLGAVTFAGSAPAFLLAPLAGVVADRINRHRMLIAAQSLAMLQSLLLAYVTLSGSMTAGRLIGFALVLGAITAFENPARQSFFVELVSRDDLPNAIALNASMVNAARVIGPALAGLVVAAYGEGFCFLLNALSFVAVLLALLMMKLTPKPTEAARHSQFEQFRVGWAFIRRTPFVRALLTVFGILNLAGTAYLTLLPIFAATVLHVGPKGLGWLMAASGAGAVATATMMASQQDARHLPRAVLAAVFTSALALIIVGLSRSFALTLLMMVLTGGSYVLTLAATQTLLQTGVPDELRGRVMSFYSVIFLGFQPVGGLLAGWLAERIGAPRTVLTGGVICLFGALQYQMNLRQTRITGLE